MVTTIRLLLREGTREHHARAEARLPLLDPALDRATYEWALAALLGVQAPLEDALAGADWHRVGLDWGRTRRRAPLLVLDLARLGWAPAAVAAIPRCAAVPHPRTLGGALGCAYVLEGSTLGGQLVRRHVAGVLGIRPGTAAPTSPPTGTRSAPCGASSWRRSTAA
jgi:heme oxygenase